MNVFDVSAVLLTGCAFGSFINYKWIKLPSSIGLLLIAMCLGLIGLFFVKSGLIDSYYIQEFVTSIDFKEIVFHGMLSFLLFAGALQINIEDLKNVKIPIALTATISTLLSTLIIGIAFYFLANALGFTAITFLYALLFGAILSPTDPVAALSIVKKMRVSKKIETIIIGESLFNDGVAIVFFISILGLINASDNTDIYNVLLTSFQSAGGGILFGILLGWVAYQMLLNIDAYTVELFITLAVATGGYTLAEKLHLSAPLAMVVAGIIIGNEGKSHAMSDYSRKYIEFFWEAIDEILNAVLFFLIGLEMMVINAGLTLAILGLACIFFALAARYISIAIPLTLLKSFYKTTRASVIVLTWGGLRGAISIAMVLSLQNEAIKAIMLPCIFFVVVFAIAVQGLTLNKVLKNYKLELREV